MYLAFCLIRYSAQVAKEQKNESLNDDLIIHCLQILRASLYNKIVLILEMQRDRKRSQYKK